MKKFTIYFLLILNLPLILAAEEPVKIGVTLGLTGKYSIMSNQQLKAYNLWKDDVNSRGGILGRDVRLIVYDDKSSRKNAKELYEKLILKDKVHLLFAPYSSGITEAVLTVTEKYSFPILADGASSDQLWSKGYRFLFGIFTPASRYVLGFLELALYKGIENVAIIYTKSSFPENIASGTKKWAERFGMNVSYYRMIDNRNNFKKYIDEIKSSGAEAVIMCGYFDEAVKMRLSLNEYGWEPKAYYASVGPVLENFREKLGKQADYTFSSSQWEVINTISSISIEFKDKFISRYGIKPSYHAASAYASGQVLEYAVKKAGVINRIKVRDILANTDILTVIGRYGVNRKGEQVRHNMLTIQWQNGKKEIVWPKKMQTKRPLFR